MRISIHFVSIYCVFTTSSSWMKWRFWMDCLCFIFLLYRSTTLFIICIFPHIMHTECLHLYTGDCRLACFVLFLLYNDDYLFHDVYAVGNDSCLYVFISNRLFCLKFFWRHLKTPHMINAQVHENYQQIVFTKQWYLKR